MKKLDQNKAKSFKESDNYSVKESKKVSSEFGSDVHITNLAKKCYAKMILDPKNTLLNPEDLWVKSKINSK